MGSYVTGSICEDGKDEDGDNISEDGKDDDEDDDDEGEDDGNDILLERFLSVSFPSLPLSFFPVCSLFINQGREKQTKPTQQNSKTTITTTKY